MKKLQQFLSQAWRPALTVASLGLLAYLLYFHRLDNLLPGYAPVETATYDHLGSWRNVFSSPINMPYTLVLQLAAGLGYHHIVATRFLAALCGVLAVALFFLIARAWYGFRVGFLASLLFATSAGFLHFTRLGSPQILQMGTLAILGAVLWHRRAPRLHPYLTYFVIVLFAVLLYIPGMVWFEALTVVLIYKRILQHWNDSALATRISWPIVTVLLVAPLAVSVIRQPHLLMSILGLPASLHSLSGVGSNLLHVVLSIGVRSNGDPILWLGHSPLLNVSELILGALGLYYCIFRRSLRSLLLVGTVLAGVVLAGLGGGVTVAAIVPALYLLIASGLYHLLNEWLTVFPRNPIARYTGILVICCMLFFSGLYHIRSYFVAWPHNPATKQAFNLQRP